MPSSENQLVRLALIGAGTFAVSTHFPILSSLQEAKRVKVNLVWSRRAAAATSLSEKYGPDVKAAHAEDATANAELSQADSNDSIELGSAISALREHRHKLDAVIICVPIPQNAPFARAALTLGLHIMCEKPIAHDIETAQSILHYYNEINAAKPLSDRSIYAVAENFRYEEAFLRAREMIPSTCGRLLALSLHAQTPMPQGSRYAFGWRLKLPDAGIILDGFVHSVAGFRILAQSDVASVSATCSSNASHFNGSDTAAAHMTFANGITASTFLTFAAGVFHWELTAVGENGDVVLRRAPGKPGYYLVARNNAGAISEEFVKFCGIDREFDAFITSCHTGIIDEQLSASAAFNDMATVQCMYESSSEGRSINVPQPISC